MSLFSISCWVFFFSDLLVCSLDSSYMWSHTVFVFFTHITFYQPDLVVNIFKLVDSTTTTLSPQKRNSQSWLSVFYALYVHLTYLTLIAASPRRHCGSERLGTLPRPHRWQIAQPGCPWSFTLSHISGFLVSLKNLVALSPHARVATSLSGASTHFVPIWPVSPVPGTSLPPRYLQTLL